MITHDVNIFVSAINQLVILFTSFITFLFFSGFCLYISPLASSLVIALIIILSVCSFLVFRPRLIQNSRGLTTSNKELVSLIDSMFKFSPEINIYRLQDQLRSSGHQLITIIRRSQRSNTIIGQIPKTFGEPLILFLICLSAAFVRTSASSQEIILDSVILFFSAQKLIPSSQQCFNAFSTIYSAHHSIDKLASPSYRYGNQKPTISTSSISDSSFSSSEFNNFSSPSRPNLILATRKLFIIIPSPDVSESIDQFELKVQDVEINRGDKVAISGPSGCGKTTLINLLAGLYVPSRGSISRYFYNGRSYASSSRSTFIPSRQFAYVSQRPFIFGKTIAQHLTKSL